MMRFQTRKPHKYLYTINIIMQRKKKKQRKWKHSTDLIYCEPTGKESSASRFPFT